MLETNFVGLELKTPLIVSSGPPTWNGKAMARCVEHGAGAVVTKTIVNKPLPNPQPRIAIRGQGMQNIELYTEHSLSRWREEIAIAKAHGAVVIASIMAYSIEELTELADIVQGYGIDAIELGISCPHGHSGSIVGAAPELAKAYTEALVRHSSVPVIVKLSPNVTDIASVAMAIEAGGASAVSAIDTVRCLIGVDVETGKPLLPTFGGYSGPAVKPIALACVASIASRVKIPVSGIGGIVQMTDALEHMMVGASTFQLCTGIIWKGYDLISKINRDLSEWLERHGFSSPQEVVGIALPHLREFEEIKHRKMVASINRDICNGCKKCLSCVYEAIQLTTEKAEADPQRCTGCGTCVFLCPVDAISMEAV